MVERVLCMHEAQGSIPCSSNFAASISHQRCGGWYRSQSLHCFDGFDHINRNPPVLIRTPKLTRFEPAQYWGGGPPGNSVVLNPFLHFSRLPRCNMKHEDRCPDPLPLLRGSLIRIVVVVGTDPSPCIVLMDSTISTVIHRFSSEHRS
jgi:hypothetical protein